MKVKGYVVLDDPEVGNKINIADFSNEEFWEDEQSAIDEWLCEKYYDADKMEGTMKGTLYEVTFTPIKNPLHKIGLIFLGRLNDPLQGSVA